MTCRRVVEWRADFAILRFFLDLEIHLEHQPRCGDPVLAGDLHAATRARTGNGSQHPSVRQRGSRVVRQGGVANLRLTQVSA